MFNILHLPFLIYIKTLLQMSIKIFIPIFIVFSSFAQSKYTISGYITEKGSKEFLPGVNVYIPKLKSGTTTNNYGFFSITLPQDSIEVVFSYVGFKPYKSFLILNSNKQLNIELEIESLKEITVLAPVNNNTSQDSKMSSIDIPIEQIKQIPALMGEKDVLKVIQLLPGVQKGSEGSTGIYVRGGGPDQNLIILDEAPVYNANHLFGFFSVFNGDAIKSVELIKGGFPARYGGRLSSVIDLQMKDGNKEMFKGEVGIGIISSRLTFEGPIIKNKCSFLISARRTYIDALIYPFLPKTNKGGYFFYDLNAKLNYSFNNKNRLFLSGYFGKDKFHFLSKYNNSESRAALLWGNATGSLRWNHLFTNKLFSNLSLIFTNYQFNILSNQKYIDDYFSLNYKSSIRDLGLKYNFDFSPSPNHYIRFGSNLTWHLFIPQAMVIKSSIPSSNSTNKSKPVNAFESGLFFEDDWIISDNLKSNFGLRVSAFNSSDAKFIYPEPRFSLRYRFNNSLSIKSSYTTMYQYLHLLSNTGIGLPTDLWVPATSKVKPQKSQQAALGIYKDFLNSNITISVEGYYKWMNNVLNYKEGASFLDVGANSGSENVPDWQNKVVSGKGKSYGVELFLQKKVGKFSGWIGYTLSWTNLQFDSLNFGNPFPARYDRRHDLSLVAIYKVSDRIVLSSTWVYGTGNAITLPLSTYPVEQHSPVFNSQVNNYWPNSVNDFGAKNSFRMAPYHRLDLGVQFHKQLKHCQRVFEISVYNLYNRHNPYFYYTEYDESTNVNKLMQVSIFPILPSFSWSLKF